MLTVLHALAFAALNFAHAAKSARCDELLSQRAIAEYLTDSTLVHRDQIAQMSVTAGEVSIGLPFSSPTISKAVLATFPDIRPRVFVIEEKKPSEIRVSADQIGSFVRASDGKGLANDIDGRGWILLSQAPNHGIRGPTSVGGPWATYLISFAEHLDAARRADLTAEVEHFARQTGNGRMDDLGDGSFNVSLTTNAARLLRAMDGISVVDADYTLRAMDGISADEAEDNLSGTKLEPIFITLKSELSATEATAVAAELEAAIAQMGGDKFKYREHSRVITVEVEAVSIPLFEQHPAVKSVHRDIQFSPMRP